MFGIGLTEMNVLAFLGGIGPTEMLVFGFIAVLLFGSRLPSVARSMGKSIVEFKKGMNDIQSEVNSSINSEPAGRVTHTDRREPSAPRFEPPQAAAAQQDDPAAVTAGAGSST